MWILIVWTLAFGLVTGGGGAASHTVAVEFSSREACDAARLALPGEGVVFDDWSKEGRMYAVCVRK